MPHKLTLHMILVLALVAAAPCRAQERDEQAQPDTGRAWIGVLLGDAVDGGAEIVALLPGAPAAAADLRTGDIIVEANGTAIASQRALGQLLEPLRPGDRLDVVVVRGSQVVRTGVQLGRRQEHWSLTRPRESVRRPERTRSAASTRWNYRFVLDNYGLEVTQLTSALRQHYGAPEDAGLLVTRCDPEAVAGQAGIRVGDVLVRIGERKIQTVDQLERQLLQTSAERPLETVVVRGPDPKELTVRLSPATLDGSNIARSAAELERESLERRLRLELERLERRTEELRRALKELEDRR